MPDFRIPYSGLDLTPGIGMLLGVLQQNKANDRANAYLDMEKNAVAARNARESAEEARKKEEHEYNRKIATYSAMPALLRAAVSSFNKTGTPGYAAQNPYGVGFDVKPGEEPATNPVEPLVNAPQHEQATAPNPQTLAPGEEGPEPTPEGEAARFATPEDLMDRATANSPKIPETMVNAAAGSLGMPKSKLFATVNGKSFEVPEQADKTPFGGHYDEIYNGLIDMGEVPENARKLVAAQYKADQTEVGRNQRLKDTLEHKDTSREDQQTFLDEMAQKYKLTFDQRKQLAEIVNRGKMAAAGATTSPFLPDVLRSVEEGAPLSETAAIAAEHKIPSKAFAPLTGQITRNATAAERAGQKRESIAATGLPPEFAGRDWKSTQAAATGTKQVQRFNRVAERFKALIDDVEKNGERIDPDSKQQIQRMSKAEALAAALRPYNELSSTDASMAAERAILGPAGAFGHGWILGADLTTLKHLYAEAQQQQNVNLDTLLKPAGSSQLAPVLGGPRRQSAPQGGGMSDDEAVRMARERLARNPHDEVARKVLDLHGLKQ